MCCFFLLCPALWQYIYVMFKNLASPIGVNNSVTSLFFQVCHSTLFIQKQQMSVVRHPKVSFVCHSCGKGDLIVPNFYVVRPAFTSLEDVPGYVPYCSLNCVENSQYGATTLYRGKGNWCLDPAPIMLSKIVSEEGDEEAREIQTLIY